MNKILSAGLVLLLVLGAFYALNAADNVANTKHNLSSSGTGTYKTTSTTEICIMCHTPHTSSLFNAPLWNRTNPSGPYNMYNSPTIDMIFSSDPQLQSLACLSCHDGSTALDMLLNAPGSGNPPTNWEWSGGLDKIQDGITKVGTNLADDHPVSVSYDTTKDAEFNPVVNGKINDIPIFGPDGRVECSSCHNPHEADLKLFLRKDNSLSKLCTSCHIK